MIPKITLMDILDPARPGDVLRRTLPRGTTQRRGFWTVKPCKICGKYFEIRQHPDRPEKQRYCCGPACSNENARRIGIATVAQIRADPDRAAAARAANKAAQKKHKEIQLADPDKAVRYRAIRRANTVRYTARHPDRVRACQQASHAKHADDQVYKARAVERKRNWRLKKAIMARHNGGST